MRIGFLIVFSVISSVLSAQTEPVNKESNNAVIQNNSNTINNNIIEKDTTSRPAPDKYEIELQEENRANKKDIKPKRVNSLESKSKMVEAEEIPETSADDSDQIVPSSHSYYSTEFESSRKKASVQRSQRSPTVEQQTEMNQAVDYFEKNAPNSFEYHYFKYVAGNYNISLINDLREAEKLRPDNVDVHVHLGAYYMIKENNDSTLLYLEKLIISGKLNKQVIQYAEDLLISVPENGTLITHGFDDTYSVVYQQLKNNIRPDVRLISLDFLQSEDYRNYMKSEGYILPESAIVNIDYLKSFCELNFTRKIGLSSTIPKEYLQEFTSRLFITGLIFEYHIEAFNNYYRNDELWNYLLKKEVVSNAIDDKSRQLSANYLPMLLQLRKVYLENGDDEKWKEVDEILNHIGVQCNKYEQVQQLKSAY